MTKRGQWTKEETSDSSEEDEENVVVSQNNDFNVDFTFLSLDTPVASNTVIAATLKGYDGLTTDYENQDCHLQTSPWKNAVLMGVMDGHDKDGAVISEHVPCELPRRLSDKLSTSNDEALLPTNDVVVAAIKEAFCETHYSLPDDIVGGSTASIVLQWGSKLYIANVGDSVTLVAVCNSKKVNGMYQTRVDRPSLSEERERIQQMGGRVSSCERVMYQDESSGQSWKPGVAMSRSIGDRDMIGVIPEPLVDVLDMRELLCNNGDAEDSYILSVCATDGMSDCIRPMELVQSVATVFSDEKNKNPAQAIKDLMCTAVNVWRKRTGGSYRDDITLVACQTKLNS